jgi:hypothetical protein
MNGVGVILLTLMDNDNDDLPQKFTPTHFCAGPKKNSLRSVHAGHPPLMRSVAVLAMRFSPLRTIRATASAIFFGSFVILLAAALAFSG